MNEDNLRHNSRMTRAILHAIKILAIVSGMAVLFILVVRAVFFVLSGYCIDPTLCEIVRYSTSLQRFDYVLQSCGLHTGLVNFDRVGEVLLNETSATRFLSALFLTAVAAFVVVRIAATRDARPSLRKRR